MKNKILFSVLTALSILSMSSCIAYQKVYDCNSCDAVVYKEGVATGQTLYRQDSLLKYSAILFRLEALNNYAEKCRGGIKNLTREDIIVLKNVKDMVVENEAPVVVQSTNSSDWNHRIDGVDFGDSDKSLPIGQRVKNVLGYINNIVLSFDRDFTTMGEIRVKKDNCMMTWTCERDGKILGLRTYNKVNDIYLRSQNMFSSGERCVTDIEEKIDNLYKEKVLKK